MMEQNPVAAYLTVVFIALALSVGVEISGQKAKKKAHKSLQSKIDKDRTLELKNENVAVVVDRENGLEITYKFTQAEKWEYSQVKVLIADTNTKKTPKTLKEIIEEAKKTEEKVQKITDAVNVTEIYKNACETALTSAAGISRFESAQKDYKIGKKFQERHCSHS